MLSLVVITKNEEVWIRNCLKSVDGLVGEIIVVDSGSTDKTVEICKKFGAKVISHPWEGYSAQKNFAFSKATGDWILSLDADERLSKKLKEEIIKTIENTDKSAFSFPRQNILLGKSMRYGGWAPDYVTRLVRKSAFIKWQGDLHEEIKFNGEVGKLTDFIYHLSHRGISWMLKTSIEYTFLEAKLRYTLGHPKITWWRLLRVMLTEFWYRFVVKAGWRDGDVGWIESISQAFNMFLIYAHLWEMQQGKTMEEIYKDIDKELETNGF